MRVEETRLLFATDLGDEELEELKAFVDELTGLLEKHYLIKWHVEYTDVMGADEEDWLLAQRAFLVLSSKPGPGEAAFLDAVSCAYRASGADGVTAYVAESVVGKRFKALLTNNRSLVEFGGMDDLKFRLFYDICAVADTGGLSAAGVCLEGKVRIAGAVLETVDASGCGVFAGNEEYMRIKEGHDACKASYLAQREQYAEKQADTEYLKEYTETANAYAGAVIALEGKDRCISDIISMTSSLRTRGLLNAGYRIACHYFMKGDILNAYAAAKSSFGDAKADCMHNSYAEGKACKSALQYRLTGLVPDEFYINKRTKPLHAKAEMESALMSMYRHAAEEPRLTDISQICLAQIEAWDNGRHSRRPWLRDEVKKRLDFVKKKGGDNKRFDMYRLSCMLANYYLKTGNMKTCKLYLDKTLALAQELNKEYKGIYDKAVGDTFLTFAAMYTERGKGDEAEEMIFCAADRYKSSLARNPEDKESLDRLAKAYKTLAVRFFANGSVDRAKEYLEKAEDKFADLYKTDRRLALEELYGMYEDFADTAQEAGNDVGEAEDYLLRSLKANKELACLFPSQYKVRVAIVYSLLGALYKQADEYDEAMDYYRSAVAEYKTDLEAIGDCYAPMLAKCYCNMFSNPQSKDMDEALECLTWAKDAFIAAAADDPVFFTKEIAFAWSLIANAQKMKGDTEMAIAAHNEALMFFGRCNDMDEDDKCYIANMAMELSAIGELYDQDKEEDAEKAARAEEFHLKAIGMAYCGEMLDFPDMGDSLEKATSSYTLSLLHPGFTALLGLIYRYMSDKDYEDTEDLANKAADYSDTRPDVAEEDEHVVSQMLAAVENSKRNANEDPDATVFLLGAYHALSVQYESMGMEKEARKYKRKAKRLFNEEYDSRQRDTDDYGPGGSDEYYDNADYSSLAAYFKGENDEALGDDALREILGEELYDMLSSIFAGEEDLPEGGLIEEGEDASNGEELSGPDPDKPGKHGTDDAAYNGANNGANDGANAGADDGANTGADAGADEGAERNAKAYSAEAAEAEADAMAKASYDDILARFISGLDEDPNPDDSGPDGKGGERS